MQSSALQGFGPLTAIDGIIDLDNQTSSTLLEESAWWELDLGNIYDIKGIKIHRKSTSDLSNYYILVSESPFPTNILENLLFLNGIQKYHVASNYPADYYYEFGFGITGRYIRIQRFTYGRIELREVEIPGTNIEDCTNGIDDDCDGKIDCDDSDCAPHVTNAHIIKQPSCKICTDGSIGVQAYAKNITDIRISIDGGNNFINPSGSYYIFDKLLEGDYHIVVKDVSSGCQASWVKNPVSLRAPAGNPNNCCNNGDFENGDFLNWTGGVGTNNQNGLSFPGNNDDFDTVDDPGEPYDDASHSIIGSGYTDIKIPNLPVSQGSNAYVARLGNSRPFGGADKMTYCFTVEECNANFLFNYMVVLQDPPSDHTADEKPFFQFTFTDLTTNEIVKQEKRISDVGDPFFSVFQEEGKLPIVYTLWKCETTDLSDRIGHSMCLEFITADCSKNCHFGYGYLDGLCNSLDDMKPKAILKNFYNIYCAGQKIIVDGSESYGYNQYSWSLCKISGGQEVDCVTYPPKPGNIEIIDFEEQYRNGGYNIQCGQNYRIKLSLINDCTAPTEISKDILYSCQPGVDINYEDVINCKGENAVFQLNGTVNNCNNCQFEWTPSQYLLNPNSATPTVNGASNVLAIKQTYHVKAQSATGCIDEDEVEIINLTGDFFKAKIGSNFCDVELIATFSSDKLTKRGTVSVKFRNITTGIVIDGVIVGSDEFALVWQFTSGSVSRAAFNDGFWKAELIYNTPHTNCVNSTVDIGQISTTDNLFFGGFPIHIPTGFTPDGDGTNDTFGAFVIDNPLGINAYWGRLRIYNRWGDKIFDKSVSGPIDSPLNTQDLRWNGTANGQPSPMDAYVYIYELENCSIQKGVECTQPICQPGTNPSTWCNCSTWTGSINLIR